MAADEDSAVNGICDTGFKLGVVAFMAAQLLFNHSQSRINTEQIKINAQQFENNDIQQRHLGELTVGGSATYGQQVHDWGEIDRRLNNLEKRQATK